MTKPNISHIATADGSSTLHSAKFDCHYHSINGAITESMHIFIEAGLKSMRTKDVNLLEIGFGTGLNAALTAQFAEEMGIKVSYHSLELYPLSSNDYNLLNYSSVLPKQTAELWKSIYSSEWNIESKISQHLNLIKINADFTKWTPTIYYDLVYFDAFAPNDQPEMWTQHQFQKIYNAMNKEGILVTYSVKGIVKNALKESGFSIERLPGPPGKLHILRAKKSE
jgi:tRNA U34 5-methylaminomethyl-2-thiouridine-forming methyltransferase MnmC